MQELKFNNKIYGRGWALPFTYLQWIFGVGFAYILAILVLPPFTLTPPDVLLPLVYVFIPLSFVGFPFVIIVKHGYRKLLRQSELNIGESGISYKRMVEQHWTVVGHVEEYNVFETHKIDEVIISKRYYTCRGLFTKTVINNDRKLSTEQVGVLKIPRAYENMEKLEQCGRE